MFAINRDRWQLDRRTFLRGVGTAIALPWLEAMSPLSKSVCNAGEIAAAEVPRRAVFTYWGLGVEIRAFTPRDTGRDYTLTRTLEPLAPYKADCTVMTGMRSFSGGHGACCCMLTGVNTVRNGRTLQSVDQQLGDFHGAKTRLPSLVLSTDRDTGFGGATPHTLSWGRNRTPITPENRPEVVFERLFRAGDPAARAARREAMDRQASLLDAVAGQARTLEARLGRGDRARLDQYFTSIREIEGRLRVEHEWMERPRPQVTAPDFGRGSPRDRIAPDGRGYSEYARLMFDVIALAFQTDSTRVVSHIPRSEGDEGNCYKFRTNSQWGLHTLSHHDEQEEKVRMWGEVDRLYMEEWAYFLGKLRSIREGTRTVLDHTLGAWATINGGFGAHDSTMLPLILCGGAGLGVRHQGHLPQQDVPIANVWQTMVDRIGMPLPDNFQGGQATGVINSLI